MAHTSRLRAIFLRHLSKPAYNRPIYQAIASRKAASILELGMGTGRRALGMIEAAAEHLPVAEVRYTGVDLFEARHATEGHVVTLKQAHRLLQATGARVQLAPGDPQTALARVANRLGRTDLVVISHDVEPSSLAAAWFYLPRMMHDKSLVFIEENSSSGGIVVRQICRDDIERLAKGNRGRAA